MSWTDSDEQLYQALALEQQLSTGGQMSAQRIYGSTYPCTVSQVTVSKGQGIRHYWKMPRRWHVDPFNPWTLMLLLLLIPANIVYLCFQGLRSLASARSSWSTPRPDTAGLEPNQVSFSPNNVGLNGPVSYANITSIGHYANGLRIDQGKVKLLLQAETVPLLFVALRHFAPHATVTSGLIAPDDFVDRCLVSGRHLDLSQMAKTPPSTWVSQPKSYNPPIPTKAIFGIGLIAFLVLCFIVLSV